MSFNISKPVVARGNGPRAESASSLSSISAGGGGGRPASVRKEDLIALGNLGRFRELNFLSGFYPDHVGPFNDVS